jgi:hypothetical protein
MVFIGVYRYLNLEDEVVRFLISVVFFLNEKNGKYGKK